jgi:AcrR family transcriptional regulator
LRKASATTVHSKRNPQRKQPVQDRSRATVDAILQATLQVLLQGGLSALTTTAVAERAGVSVGTLYQYFPDKAALVLALKLLYVDRLVGAVATAAVNPDTDGPDIEPTLRAMLRALVQTKRDNLSLTLALREPMSQTEPHAGGRVAEQGMARLVGVVKHVLDRAVPPLQDTDRAARVIVAAVEGASTLGLYDDAKLLASRVFLDELDALVLGFLRARAGAQRPRRRVARSS